MKELDNGADMTPELIQLLVDDFAPIAEHRKALYDRYTMDQVPIYDREVEDGTKVNNLIANDFAGEIVDQKIGYALGNAIKYNVDKNSYGDETETFQEHQGEINRFVVRNAMNDKDIELGKMASICGVAGREVYVDKDGNERVVNLNPWETLFLTDSDDNVKYALRIRQELRMVGNKLTDLQCVDFYNEDEVTYFIEKSTKDGKTFAEDDEQEENPAKHIFDFTPIVKISNNDEEMGDFERVISLIDGYDRTMSDVNSEIEQFRMAYMYFKGVEVDKETIEEAKTAGGFQIPEDGDIGFITKQMSDVYVKNHLDNLERNINRFAKHVNMSDKDFGGGDSSLANKYKLSALEMKSGILEVKMKTALLRQFQILTSAWDKKGRDIDYLNLQFLFTRNLPVNILEEADQSVKLKGLVSERTRLSLLSSVDDVDMEIEQMARDRVDQGYTIPEEEPVEDRIDLSRLEEDIEDGDDVDEQEE